MDRGPSRSMKPWLTSSYWMACPLSIKKIKHRWIFERASHGIIVVSFFGRGCHVRPRQARGSIPLPSNRRKLPRGQESQAESPLYTGASGSAGRIREGRRSGAIAVALRQPLKSHRFAPRGRAKGTQRPKHRPGVGLPAVVGRAGHRRGHRPGPCRSEL